MKKPSMRKSFRKKTVRVRKKDAMMKKQFEKSDFLQWVPTTVNGIKQEK